MMNLDIKSMLQGQRQFFASGKTLSLEFRLEQLKKLQLMLEKHEQEIYQALKQDLQKSPNESYLTEYYLVQNELKFIIKNLKKWVVPQTVSSPFPLLWPGKSKIYKEPYGCVFIIAPWNYPLLLLISPLIGAMSAGNCVTLKPSEVSVNTQNLLVKLIKEYFPPEYVNIVIGGAEETSVILQEKFDYIFYTGSTRVGKLVMEAAAKNLTPVTLELGGKSPCIIDESANLDFAAKRIIWGKFINVGQTCIAPDYLYIHQSIKNEMVNKLQKVIKQFYGDDPAASTSYGRVINKRHFDNLINIMQNAKIIYGGKINPESLYISPTLLDNVSWQDSVMQQEIFGPILPILTYHDIDEVIAAVKANSKPLALYLFSQDQKNIDKILSQLSFGGGCINDCLVQLANGNMPFGGVGLSGMGQYHGEYSFNLFSHQKSIYQKTMSIDFDFQYPPYTEKKLSLLKMILNFFS